MARKEPRTGPVGSKLDRPFSEKVIEARGYVAHNMAEYNGKTVVSCSFGKDSLVVLHLALQNNPDVPVVFNDTGVEHPETIQFAKYLTKEWNLNLTIARPSDPWFKLGRNGRSGRWMRQRYTNYWQCVAEFGFARGGKRTGKNGSAGTHCCYYLKDKPMGRSVRENGWKCVIDGLTAAESRQRTLRAVMPDYGACYRFVEWDAQKVHPILWWTEGDVWEYILRLDLPFNDLYSQGSERVGCMTCTAYARWESEMQRLTPKLYPIIRERMAEEDALVLHPDIKVLSTGNLDDSGILTVGTLEG